MASYSQESTRYCNYTKDKFGNELTFIYPTEIDYDALQKLKEGCAFIEKQYMAMLETCKPECARAILPNCIKTDLVCTMNIRELRNFFKLRTTSYAHPDIRVLAVALLETLRAAGLGVLFEDIEVDTW